MDEDSRQELRDQALDIAESILISVDDFTDVIDEFGVSLTEAEIENLHSLIHSAITEYLTHSKEF